MVESQSDQILLKLYNPRGKLIKDQKIQDGVVVIDEVFEDSGNYRICVFNNDEDNGASYWFTIKTGYETNSSGGVATKDHLK